MFLFYFSGWIFHYGWFIIDVFLFPVKLNVNTSGATGLFDAAAVILGKTNDFAELLD